jgi:mRNA interferase MazF
MVGRYIPAQGDIVKFNFDPTLGREQAGFRPALIVTPKAFNQSTQLALACPITSKVKGFPLEVILPEGLITSGVVLVFQVKTIDWLEHQAKYVESLPAETLAEAIAKLHAILG